MTWALLTGAHGQKTNAVKERTFLQIGDTVPNIFIPYIQNYKQSSLRFSSFKDKWVILDFWFGTCKSCIEAFPKMEALQRQLSHIAYHVGQIVFIAKMIRDDKWETLSIPRKSN